jgi:uncharacterized protein (DUF2267 family)
MITHERLVERVAAEAHSAKPEDAAHTARTVLAELGLHLDMPRRRRLRQALPAVDRDAAYAIVPPLAGGAAELFRDIGEHLSVPPERARQLTRTVLAAIADFDPDLPRDLGPYLPPGVADLFPEGRPDPARPGTAPGKS